MRIWRDIPSRAALARSLGGDRQLFKTIKDDPQARGTERILEMVEQYHAIRKDEYGQLDTRRGLLHDLARQIEDTFRSKKVEKKLEHKMANATDINTFLFALWRRVQAKETYLEILLDYYRHNTGEIANPQSLIQQLTAPRVVAAGQPLPLVQGTRLERIDPIHRSWELNMNGPGGLPAGSTIPQIHCCQWFRKVLNEGYNQPLFVYLENTDTCLDRDTARDAHVVAYIDPADLAHRVFALRVHATDGFVSMHEPGTSDSRWKKFDTTWVTRQHTAKGGSTRSLAYIWMGVGGEFFADLHNPLKERGWDTFHHSSFRSGGDVMCAGMISAKDGKITHIDNDSGHYQPTSEHLLALVWHLYNKTTFAAGAKVRDVDPRRRDNVAGSNEGIDYARYAAGNFD